MERENAHKLTLSREKLFKTLCSLKFTAKQNIIHNNYKMNK